MNTFLIILFLVIILMLLLGIGYIYFYNQINDRIIRIKEAESRIDDNLRDKYDALNKAVSIVKNKIELNSITFRSLAMLKTQKISNFDLDRSLVKSYNELLTVYEENKKKLNDSDELYKTIKELELIDEELVVLREYYNGNITSYNKMIKKFPSLIVAKIKKYKEKLFYDLKDMNDDDIEDFKL